jgi:hypothetical protein
LDEDAAGDAGRDAGSGAGLGNRNCTTAASRPAIMSKTEILRIAGPLSTHHSTRSKSR